MKIFFLIWEHFRSNKKVQTIKITEANFKKAQDRNIEMLKYIRGEDKSSDKMDFYSYDLENIKSKSLLTAVLFRYNTRPVLMGNGQTE